MKPEFIAYLAQFGFRSAGYAKAERLLGLAEALCPDPPEAIYLSEFAGDDGSRSFLSFWIFTSGYAMEGKNFAGRDETLELTALKKNVTYVEVSRKDYDLKQAVDSSRFTVHVGFGNGVHVFFRPQRRLRRTEGRLFQARQTESGIATLGSILVTSENEMRLVRRLPPAARRLFRSCSGMESLSRAQRRRRRAVKFPTQWTNDDYLWKIKLPGRGHSDRSPGRMISSSPPPLTRSAPRLVLCIDAAAGNAVAAQIRRSRPTRCTSVMGSPPHAGRRMPSTVYVAWATPKHYLVQALDRATGKDVWQVDLGPFISRA